MSVVLHEESDAELDAKSDGTWVGVGKLFSVLIRRTSYGVAVSVCAKGYEDCNDLASCYAYTRDALDMQQESEGE